MALEGTSGRRGVSEERLMGHQTGRMWLWTLSLGHEPRKEEMLTFEFMSMVVMGFMGHRDISQ